MSSTGNQKTIRLTDDDIRIMEELKKAYGATSNKQVVRKALAQCHTLVTEAGEDGTLSFKGKDDHMYKLILK